MRKRIFEIIEVADDGDKVSRFYDIFMIITIVISLVPLMTVSNAKIYWYIDKITVAIFIVDYIFRFMTADMKMKRGKKSFLRYPFTFMALIDLVSILPSIIVINKGFRLFKVFRLARSLRVFRAVRYSKNVNIIIDVFKRKKDLLLVVCGLAIGYILISALVIFNIEPESFNNSFFEAIYWATISLTTVGYGDLYATSKVGKAITMISALFGVAIIALPAGIITAGYMEIVEKK